MRSTYIHVFVTGGIGHSGPYIISDLIAAGHEVTALARSDKGAAVATALGVKVSRGNLADLDGSWRGPLPRTASITSRTGRT